MTVGISKYNLLCNLGNDVDTAFERALNGVDDCFCVTDKIIKGKNIRLGLINCELDYEIKNPDFDLRCNKLALKCLEPLKIEDLIKKYTKDEIAIVVATTNSGTEEYSKTKNPRHAKLSNPAEFIREYYGLNNYYTSVSSACSSGNKAFSIARELINSGYSKSVIVLGVDPISKIPVFGFNSLEILSDKKSNPFSANRFGINIAEGVAAFIIEKQDYEIEIAGIGETTDYYHSTTPEPQGVEAKRAINLALKEANLKPSDIDYINLHGTGTIANDIMEANAIYDIFQGNVIASSTKPLTGHCLGAAAGVEAALCIKLLETNSKRVFPHIFDNDYDKNLAKIHLAKKGDTPKKMENILCTAFGFSGTNTAIILKKAGKN